MSFRKPFWPGYYWNFRPIDKWFGPRDPLCHFVLTLQPKTTDDEERRKSSVSTYLSTSNRSYTVKRSSPPSFMLRLFLQRTRTLMSHLTDRSLNSKYLDLLTWRSRGIRLSLLWHRYSEGGPGEVPWYPRLGYRLYFNLYSNRVGSDNKVYRSFNDDSIFLLSGSCLDSFIYSLWILNTSVLETDRKVQVPLLTFVCQVFWRFLKLS